MKTFSQFVEDFIAEEVLDEENKPTDPEKWAKAKSAAKSKFAVYPSAYANAWASKKYKSMGGGWRSTKEEVEQVDELSKKTLKSYGTKASMSNFKKSLDMKTAQQKWDKSIIRKHLTKRPEFTDAEKKKMDRRANYSLDALYKGYSSKNEEVELDEAKSPAWTRSAGKDPEGGLNRKGIASYRRENPGSKLSMAVTTPPSKLKKDSKAAKRRKSFCARMGGMKKRLTSAKTARDPDSRINKALRKWNC